MPHITIVGTSHIAEKSVKHIKHVFLTTKPDIIAVELDRRRLEALLTDAKQSNSPRMIKHIGFSGYLFALIGGWLQRKLGRMVGMQPGVDMKQAALLAKNNNLQLLLMDRDITVTLKRLSKRLTAKEKLRFASDLLFGWMKKSNRVTIDLKKVPESELVVKLLEQLKGRYPTFYDVLVHERNVFMARRLLAVAAANPDKHIMAVVGAGHVQGMQEQLKLLVEQAQTQHS